MPFEAVALVGLDDARLAGEAPGAHEEVDAVGVREPMDDPEKLQGIELDLEPLLRDTVVLDLPFTPLCRPDCAGLCPDCGANLNADPDHLHDDRIDPRWAALSGWTTDPDDEDEASMAGSKE